MSLPFIVKSRLSDSSPHDVIRTVTIITPATTELDASIELLAELAVDEFKSLRAYGGAQFNLIFDNHSMLAVYCNVDTVYSAQRVIDPLKFHIPEQRVNRIRKAITTDPYTGERGVCDRFREFLTTKLHELLPAYDAEYQKLLAEKEQQVKTASQSKVDHRRAMYESLRVEFADDITGNLTITVTDRFGHRSQSDLGKVTTSYAGVVQAATTQLARFCKEHAGKDVNVAVSVTFSDNLPLLYINANATPVNGAGYDLILSKGSMQRKIEDVIRCPQLFRSNHTHMSENLLDLCNHIDRTFKECMK